MFSYSAAYFSQYGYNTWGTQALSFNVGTGTGGNNDPGNEPTERMRITEIGVGIGTTAPMAAMQITSLNYMPEGAVTNTPGIGFGVQNNTGSGHAYSPRISLDNGKGNANVANSGNQWNIDNYDGSFRVFQGSTNAAFVIGANGNVGIGSTGFPPAPDVKLEVCGNMEVMGWIKATGTITTDGTITCSSDLRFKKNISPLNNALSNILSLRGVNYDWRINEFPEKNFSKGNQIGFIAQELEKVYPEFVFTDKDGYKSVDYSRLTPILVEAIKEQQKIIDSYDKRLKVLEELLGTKAQK